MTELTHKDKVKTLLKLEELRRIKEDRERARALENYRPHPKQSLFHENCDKFYCMFVGGNQSGKTTAGLCDDIADALGYEPWSGKKRHRDPPLNIVIGAPDYPNFVGNVIIPKLMQYLPKDAIEHIEKIQGKYINKILLKNGSVFSFMTYEQDPIKWEGSTNDIVHFDEPPPREHYIAALRGLIARRGRMKFTFTAIAQGWIKDELIDQADPKDIFTTHVRIFDNPYLTDEFRKLYLNQLDPDELRARAEGDFMHLGGQIYKSFDKSKQVIPESDFDPTQYPCGLVMDPHDRKPFMLAWFAVMPEGEIVFFKEWPDWDLFHKIKSHENTVQDYIDLIKQTEDELGIADNMVWRFMDPNSGKARNAAIQKGANTGDGSFSDLFALQELYFDTDVVDNLAYGHKMVKDYLRENKLFFTSNLVSLPNAMVNYRWDEFKMSAKGIKEVPEEKYKDPADCVRYAVVKEPSFVDFSAPVVSNSGRARDPLISGG